MQGSNSFPKLFTEDTCERQCAHVIATAIFVSRKIKKLNWEHTEKEENSVCRTNITLLPSGILWVSVLCYLENCNPSDLSTCVCWRYTAWCNTKRRWQTKMQLICQTAQWNVEIHIWNIQTLNFYWPGCQFFPEWAAWEAQKVLEYCFYLQHPNVATGWVILSNIQIEQFGG